MRMPMMMGTAALCLLVMNPANGLETGFGNFDADLRFRYESVEQDNALKDAEANTLHARLGFTTKPWHDFTFSIQGEAVTAIGDDDYNSGPDGNGNTDFSVIPDPEGEELNQLWLAYAGLPGTTVKLGRQRIIYDNARFVGNVGWRQNEQTYDGLTLSNSSLANTTINLAWLTRVNNIFFQDIELEKAALLNLKYEYAAASQIGAYAYFLDYEDGFGPDLRTLGVRADGELFKRDGFVARYRLEYARQTDYADNPATIDLDYSLLELGLNWSAVKISAGMETLEGDGTRGFLTPLATLHAFNGWADQFLVTPAIGLVDRYVGAAAKLGKANLQLVYHDFVSDIGSVDHGTEWDASIGFSPVPGWSLLLKYADYQAQATSVDTQKLWLQAAYVFK